MKLIELRSGIKSNFEFAIRFAHWCDTQMKAPTWRDVKRHYRVNRATAYRWLAAWKAARDASA